MRWLIPPVLLLLCVALMVLLRGYWPIMTILPYPFTWLGIVPVVLGLGLGVGGAITFRKARTNMRPFREADALVTGGPYRYTRNPMYLGLALVLVGTWLGLGALSPLLGVLIFVVVADRWYIGFEEAMLRQKFGAAFEAYCAATRRWL